MSSTMARFLNRMTFGFAVDPAGDRRRPVWGNVIVLGVVLPVASVWSIYRVFTTHTGPGLWLLALGFYAFTLFGVTLGNHRYWTHRGYKVKSPLRGLLAVASGMAVQGPIEQWVTTHRAHHRYSDVVGLDPHSPFEYSGWRGLKGLIWAQGLWLLFDHAARSRIHQHRDLADDKLVQKQRTAFPYLAGGQFLILLALYPVFGWNGVFIAGALRVTALLTTTGLVNSVCHRWGSRASDSAGNVYSRDHGRNNVLVALLTGGEGNHAWHHADPVCPKHGRKPRLDVVAVRAGHRPDRGWRPDATWRLIQLLTACNLIYEVRKPRRFLHFPRAQVAARIPGASAAA
jgi:stearoyl-CoA desaturase (delta-9 desaturase)